MKKNRYFGNKNAAKPKISKICLVCSTNFFVRPSKVNQKFCSYLCYYKFRTGENHPKWIEDRTKLKRTSKQGERRTSAYFFWRKSVWERDEYKCKINNKDCKGRLEAHHILNWADCPELRYEVNNGITLCLAHHPRKRELEAKLSPYFQSLVAEMK
jgi:hypothetical protein